MPARSTVMPMLAFTIAAVGACADLNQASQPPTTYDSGGSGDGTGGATDTTDAAATTDTAVGDVGEGDSNVTDAADATAADTSEPAGTCTNRCGAPYQPTASCQCNGDCPKFGNCCPDWGPVCKPAEMTCQGRCEAGFSETKPCQCTWDCARYGTCCPDWTGTCHPEASLDWFPAPTGKCSKDTDWLKVKFIPDGDTLQLEKTDSKGEHLMVRFLLVDTPEISSSDCMALDAKKYTSAAVQKSGQQVCIVNEPKGDDKDTYGRLLRYVFVKDPTQPGPVELNLRLLRLGLGRVLYPFAKGNPHEPTALMTMAKAKEEGKGGWSACGWLKPK